MFSIRSKIAGLADKADKYANAYHVEVNVSNRTLFRIFAVLFIFLLLVAAVRQAGPALILLFTAFFLALALNAPVQWVADHLPGKARGSRSLATTISVTVVLALLIGFLASIVPSFVRQISGLVDTIPSLVNDINDQNSDIGGFVQRYELQDQVEAFGDDLSGRLQSFAGSAVSTLGNIGSSLFATLTVLVLTFMMLVEGPRWVTMAERLVPKARRQHTRELARAMYKIVKGYVNGQVILAGVAAILILPVFVLSNVNYPVALMVVVFICGLIPMVGHTIGAVIATAVALFTSPLAAAIVLGYYIVYQQVENYFVQPRIQANSTNMSPLLVFAAVVIGVSFGGLLGGLVAIPIMGCIRILVLDQLTRRHLLESESAKATLAKAEAPDKPKTA